MNARIVCILRSTLADGRSLVLFLLAHLLTHTLIMGGTCSRFRKKAPVRPASTSAKTSIASSTCPGTSRRGTPSSQTSHVSGGETSVPAAPSSKISEDNKSPSVRSLKKPFEFFDTDGFDIDAFTGMPTRNMLSEEKEQNIKAFIDLVISNGAEKLFADAEKLAEDCKINKCDRAVAFNHPLNKDKNRYKDIPCNECNRVKLEGGSHDYIHANYIPTPRDTKRFISAQGPMNSTMADMWRMIVQEECDYIVMLCNTIENKKEKCAQYFPSEEGETQMHFAFEVKCLKKEEINIPGKIAVRQLQVKDLCTNNTHTVVHFHWEDWPDRGVPPLDGTLLNLLKMVTKSKKPICVHCSAGIGRTGTLFAVQIAKEMLELGEDLSNGMLEIVKSMRKNRALAIHNEKQYCYANLLLVHFLKRDGMFDDKKLEKLEKDVESRCKEGYLGPK